MTDEHMAHVAKVRVIVQQVVCPRCGAVSGEPCRNRHDQEQRTHHGHRNEAAIQAGRLTSDMRPVGD